MITPLVIPTEKKMLILGLIKASLLLGVCSLYLSFFFYYTMSTGNSTVRYTLAAFLATIYFVAYTIFYISCLAQLKANKPAAVLDKSGISINTHGLIPWSSIKTITYTSRNHIIWPTNEITITLHNRNTSRRTWLEHCSLFLSYVFPWLSPNVITIVSSTIAATQLTPYIKQYLKKT